MKNSSFLATILLFGMVTSLQSGKSSDSSSLNSSENSSEKPSQPVETLPPKFVKKIIKTPSGNDLCYKYSKDYEFYEQPHVRHSSLESSSIRSFSSRKTHKKNPTSTEPSIPLPHSPTQESLNALDKNSLPPEISLVVAIAQMTSPAEALLGTSPNEKICKHHCH